MSWNGSGTYTPPGASFPEVNGTTIDADRYNAVINDIATGLTLALTKDGQNTPTANLPMGGFKHTGAAAATVAGEYLIYGQAIPGTTGTFSGNVSVGGTLGVTGAATLSSTLAVTGAATLSSTLALAGALTSTVVGSQFQTSAATNVQFDLDPLSTGGAGTATMRFFRATNTSGAVALHLYRGDGTGTLDHLFTCSATGVNSIARNGGRLLLGGTTDDTTNLFQVAGNIVNQTDGTFNVGTSAKMWLGLYGNIHYGLGTASAAVPRFTSVTDSNTGLGFNGADTLVLIAGGAARATLTTAAFTTPLAFSSSTSINGPDGRCAEIYNGSTSTLTDYPVGTILFAARDGAALIARNGAVTPKYDSGDTSRITIGGVGTNLTGTWRARGGTTDLLLVQRIS